MLHHIRYGTKFFVNSYIISFTMCFHYYGQENISRHRGGVIAPSR